MKLVDRAKDGSVIDECEILVGGALAGRRCTEIVLTLKDVNALANTPPLLLAAYMDHLMTKFAPFRDPVIIEG